jgi:hypothetical protein
VRELVQEVLYELRSKQSTKEKAVK